MQGGKGNPDKLTDLHAKLFLRSCLSYWTTKGKCSGWSIEEWNKLLEPLTPREIVVLVLKEIRDLDDSRIGELLNISRAMVSINWNNAKKKIVDSLLTFPSSL